MKIRLLVTLLGMIVLTACSFSLAGDVTPPPGSEQMPISTEPEPTQETVFPLALPDPSKGKTVYNEKCADCHGITGLGDGARATELSNPVPALASIDIARKSTPANWFNIITKGNLDRSMPPFPSLSDSERWDVIAYALSLSVSTSQLTQGEALYFENCISCHGEKGAGDGTQASSLSTPPANLTDQSFMVTKSTDDLFQAITDGFVPLMPSFKDFLTVEERWLISEYIRTFTFKLSSEPQVTELLPTPAITEQPQPTLESTQIATQGYGTITGNVINASSEENPSGLAVTLYGFDESEQVITETTTLKMDGSFTFNNVELVEGRMFAAGVEYGGMTYGSDIAVVPSDTHKLVLPITVYDSTTDGTVIKIDRLHLFFELINENTMRVVELYIMSNTSTKSLVPTNPKEPIVRFKLPVGSSNLQFQDGVLGERFQETPDGFGDTSPVLPGSSNYQVLFAFEMPYNQKLDFVQPLLLPVDAVVILVPEGDIRIKGEGLEDSGTRNMQDIAYHMYNSGSLPKNSDLRLAVTGRSGSGSLSLTKGNQSGMIVGLSVFGFALILAGVWLFRHTKIEEADETEDELLTSTEPTADNIEALMDAIIALDDLYQTGDLAEEAYQKRRAEFKQHLHEITSLLKKG
jgi:mono/diheme cytochrome c family protein